MKKIYSILLTTAATIGLLTSCADVPMPYDINSGGELSYGKSLPYKSANLNAGWTTHCLTTGYEPWSQGANYTQATGYQKWDGASDKSNHEVEGYLVSPPLNLKSESGQVRLRFDHVIMYSGRDAQYPNHIGLLLSKNYDGHNFEAATWEKIPFTIESQATPSSTNWTCYPIPSVQVPDMYVGHDSVYVAFYFYASSSASITWELQNFLIEEGVADDSGNGGGSSTEPAGTKEAPLTVAEAKTKVGQKGYVIGYIVGYVDGQKLEEGAKFEAAAESQTELLLADTPDETTAANTLPVQLPVGDLRTKLNPNIAENIGKQVVLYGSFENYFGIAGMKSTSWALFEGESLGQDPDVEVVPDVPTGTPSGTGTAEDPYNVAAVYAFAMAGNYSNSNPSEEIYIKGIVSKVGDLNTKYNELNYYISDDGTTAGQFYVYNGYGLNGENITSADYLKTGDVVLICGKLTTYNGTPQVNYGSKIITINGNGEGGGETPTPTPTGNITRTAEGTTLTIVNNDVATTGSSITYNVVDAGLENKAQVTDPIKLSDGTVISFNSGTNAKNTPTYYTSATAGDIRVYGDNNVVFNSEKAIKSITLECSSIAAGPCVGNEEMTCSVDGNTFTICNTGGTTQLRIQTITITYAE